MTGLFLAGAFTALTYATGQPHWDALGSIAVGVLMGAIAVQLMRTNKRFLIGGWPPGRPAAWVGACAAGLRRGAGGVCSSWRGRGRHATA